MSKHLPLTLIVLTLVGRLYADPAATQPAFEYPYAPYNQGQMDPQTTGWPLTEKERAYVLKPEHERRPGREQNKHLPAMWPVTPSAGSWGGTSWLDTHAKLVKDVEAAKGPIDVLLVGDSITMQWDKAWTKNFPTLKTVNLGIGGDKTQNVLWRLDHGGVAGIEPKVIVLLIGNNNMFFTAETGIEPVAQGIKVCAANLRNKFPKAQLIVVKIFPAHAPGNRFYEDIKKTNAALDKLKLDAENMQVLDLWSEMVNADGTLKKGLFTPDNIHLTQDGGYALYASKLKPLIEKALGTLRATAAKATQAAVTPQLRTSASRPTQYLLINVHSPTRQVLDEIRAAVPPPTAGHPRVGFSFIVSYFARDDQDTVAYLKKGLDLARETDLPIFIWLDGEYWRGASAGPVELVRPKEARL